MTPTFTAPSLDTPVKYAPASALLRIYDMISTVAVVAMVLIAILTALDVIVFRTLLNRPIAGLNEVFATFFAVAVAALLPGGLSGRASLEIDLLAGILGPNLVARLRSFGAVFYCAMLVLLAVGVISFAMVSFRSGSITSVMRLPLWPFYGAICFFILMCVPSQARTAIVASRTACGSVRLALIDTGLILAGLAAIWLAMESGADILTRSPLLTALVLVVAMWGMMFLLIPVAACLIFASLTGVALMFGLEATLRVTGSETIGLLTSADFAIIPYFLIMGGCAVASGMSMDIYRLAHAVFAPWRGGLALATIGGSAGFGALTGSSIATVATIGEVAYPEMLRKGYSRQLAAGSIAAGGTLGQLIPPSTIVVLYAILVEQSIGALYAAMIIPALLSVVLYMAAILLMVRARPDMAPAAGSWDKAELGSAFLRCIPAICVFLLVFGGLLLGIFTVTEAAAFGAVFAFAVLVLRGFTHEGGLMGLISETTRTVSMLYFLIIGGMVFTFFIASVGFQDFLVGFLTSLDLTPLLTIAVISLVLIAFGTAFDSMTTLLITAPTLAAVIQLLGYDPIWWGVVMVMIVEIGVITPPFGINLFTMKGIAPDLKIQTLYRGVTPFIAADLVKLVLLILFPSIILVLPTLTATW